MYGVNLCVGLMTLSKAFLVVFAFEVVITLIYYAIKNKKKSLKVIKKRKCTKGKKKKKPRGLTDVMHMIVVNKELI